MKIGEARILEIKGELVDIKNEQHNQKLWALNGYGFEQGRTGVVDTALYLKNETLKLKAEMKRIKGELNVKN